MTNLVSKPRLRILVLGCGSIGRRHLENLIRLEAGDLLAYDLETARRDEVESKFGIPTPRNLEEAWEQDPNVALVAAPTPLHVELATEAARHGCHLFVEKPLSHDLQGVDALCAEVKRRGLITMVGCNMRFHAGPLTVKHWLKEGVIGQVLAARLQTGSYLPGWRPGQDYRASYSAHPRWGGAILDCVHEIDLALWYLGPGRLVGACSMPARSIGLETDGVAELILRHEDGAISNVHLNFVQRDYCRSCQVIGAEGTIHWDFGAGRVVLYGPAGQMAREVPDPEGWETNRMYVNEIAHFLQAVREDTPTANPVPEAVPALRIALAARQIGRSRSS